MLPGAAQAVENSTLLRKRAALAGFYRFHARRDPRVPAVLGELIGTRPTGSYVPMLAHARRAAPDSFSPLRITARRKAPETLTAEEAGLAMAACSRARDRFLVSLLDEAGLRIGEALGLRHEDLSLRRAEVRVVPREDNANQARAKRMKERAVPVWSRRMTGADGRAPGRPLSSVSRAATGHMRWDTGDLADSTVTYSGPNPSPRLAGHW
jgi:integrase/recombinase XerD